MSFGESFVFVLTQWKLTSNAILWSLWVSRFFVDTDVEKSMEKLLHIQRITTSRIDKPNFLNFFLSFGITVWEFNQPKVAWRTSYFLVIEIRVDFPGWPKLLRIQFTYMKKLSSYNSINFLSNRKCMKSLWQAFSHIWKSYDDYFSIVDIFHILIFCKFLVRVPNRTQVTKSLVFSQHKKWTFMHLRSELF